MVQSCPGWSSEEIFSGMLRYIGHSSLRLAAIEFRECQLLRMYWKRVTRNAPSRDPSKTINKQNV
jgi:hypothetical protein